MELIHIFSPEDNPDEGIWAVEYEKGQINAFEEIFENWQNPEYMVEFCEQHKEDVKTKFGPEIGMAAAAELLMDEADDLEELVYNLATSKKSEDKLQHLFKPLDNRDANLSVLQSTKASIKNREYRDPKCRIYALRVGENTYVVTGGAIKLTNLMAERPHTEEQLKKLNLVKAWLQQQGIQYPDDLKNVE